jgi:hypothetical protein
MEIPPDLQERTNNLLLELGTELDKDAANQFISIRSAIYYGEISLPGIDPQVVMRPASPNADEFWEKFCALDSEHSPGNETMPSNHDLDDILNQPLDSTGSVSNKSSPDFDGQGSHSKADLDIPLCQRCTCEKCKKLPKYARRKKGKHASLETVASLFPRTNLVNILDKYWEMLQVHGLFVDQSREPFQWSNAINSPVYVQRRQYHLILRKLETDDDLQQWRRFVAEYRTLEGYHECTEGTILRFPSLPAQQCHLRELRCSSYLDLHA